jgi:argininosuccinate lyase
VSNSEVSGAVLGRPIEFDEARLDDVLSARHFVEIRKTPGGPAPSEMARTLAESRTLLDADVKWLAAAREKLGRADSELTEAARAL